MPSRLGTTSVVHDGSRPISTDLDRRGVERCRAAWLVVRRHITVVVLVVLTGCSGLEPVTGYKPVTDPEQLYMALTLNYRVANLSTAAPYNTIQLTATPRNAMGEPMSGLPRPTFRSSDTTSVRVTANGLVEARLQATGVEVIAEVVAEGNIRRADTALFNVTTNPSPPELASLSIRPLPPDSTIWPIWPFPSAFYGTILLITYTGMPFEFPSLSPRALDRAGNLIPGLAIEYESLDPEVVPVDPRTGDIDISLLSRPGQARVVARTTAYGISKADTVLFTLTFPIIHGVEIEAVPDGPPAFTPSEVTIRPNGMVFWTSLSGGPVDVIFDAPANVAEITSLCIALGGAFCGAGNISVFDGSSGDPLDQTRGRLFPVPGVYSYRSTLTGATGRVVVTDGAASTASVAPQQRPALHLTPSTERQP